MSSTRRVMTCVLFLCTLQTCIPVAGQEQSVIPAGSKVYIAPMGGFETYLKAAFQAKKVPLILVEVRDKADFEITGHSESQKASTAKKLLLLDWRSREEASIKVTNLQTGIVVFAYSVHKPSSAHGKQSTAEACAKHLKKRVNRP